MSQSSALKKAPQGADRAALKQQLRDSARAMVPALRERAGDWHRSGVHHPRSQR